MANTIDQMQDVFPVSFNFVKGEQPTATKFTGWVKQTNTAFARMTKAVGDPWEYTAHSGSSGAYFLSPDRLAQASLARIIGPSDYVSPRGASFQEPISSVTVTLPSERNTWNVGFPLVKLTSDLLPTDAGLSKVSKLTWSTDIVATVAPAGLFTTEVASPDLVQSAGDFYVDYYTGTISTYGLAASEITLTISNLHMLGPGVPWGTSNVIPHWNSSSTLCWVTEISTSGGVTTYNIALPDVVASSRDTAPDSILLGAVADSDTSVTEVPRWNIYTSGSTASYRLPTALTNNLSTGDRIPEGFMYVWDESTGRIVPQTEFLYQDETNVRVQTPQGWLTVGGSVRLIVTGTSLAEAVHHLMTVSREGRHVGLSTGQHQDTLHYMVPISHTDIVDSFCGDIPSTTVEPTKYYYRSSSYPVNPHPQYIHRAGYLVDDEDGNSGNAMRGYLVFAGRYDIDSTYKLGAGTNSGTMGATYGLLFGGGTTTTSSQNAKLSWEGGTNVDTWSSTSTSAHRLGFGIDALGAQKMATTEYYGALTYTPWYGLPFYIRGEAGTSWEDSGGAVGGVLGFDYGDWNELNYIKLMQGYRSGSWDVPNQPAYLSQSYTTALDITPALTYSSINNRLAAEQVREFRFRGASYNPHARNANNGLGSAATVKAAYDISISHDATEVLAGNIYVISGKYAAHFRVGDTITVAGFVNAANNGTKTITAVSELVTVTQVTVSSSLVVEGPLAGPTVISSTNEFNAYFTSPGMVGADFINVYSNAVFFSDTGDGKITSFTSRGALWMDGSSRDNTPSGMYYVPQDLNGPHFEYSMYDSSISVSSTPLYVGDRYGFWYTSYKGGPAAVLNYNSQIVLATGFDSVDLATRISNIRASNIAGRLTLCAGDSAITQALTGIISSSIGVQLYASDTHPDISLRSWTGDISLATTTSGDITLTATDDIAIESGDILSIRSGLTSNPFTPTGNDMLLASDGEIYLYANTNGTISNDGIRIRAGKYPTDPAEDYISVLMLPQQFQVDLVDGGSSDTAGLFLSPTSCSIDTDGYMSLEARGGYLNLSTSGGDLTLSTTGTNEYVVLNTYIKSTAGDPTTIPAPSTGSIYINTSASGRIKMYADGAWRTLASW